MTRRSWDPGDFFSMGFGTWAKRPGRRRWFEAGEMRYVILELLKDKPKHGYEVMKDLEERCHGCYQPSPGTVYPTLQWLEDEGLVRVRRLDGKKVYEITDEGREFLAGHRDEIDDIFERVNDMLNQFVGGANPDVHRAVGRLLSTVYRLTFKTRDDAVRRRIAERLERAADEIDALARA